MDLEEHTLEDAPQRCEQCGAKLTDEEIAAIVETGGPTLCKIHAAEIVDVDEEGEDEPGE